MKQKIIKTYNKNILSFFVEFQAIIQLYHWTTLKYARHKASDKLFENLLELSDKIIEIYIGRYGRPTINEEYILFKKCNDLEIVNYLKYKVLFLENNFLKSFDISQTDTDLINIRDELIGSINQTLYLFTLE